MPSYLLREQNNLSIGLQMLLVVVIIVVCIVVGAILLILSAMFHMCHAKTTTLWLSIATVSIKGHPLWSLDRCKTVLHLPICSVSIVVIWGTLLVIAHRYNVMVSSSVEEGLNHVETHVVEAPLEANFSHNLVAKIIISNSLIM